MPAPFGWRVDEDGTLIEDPEQQAAIQRMIELRTASLSLRAIADRIAAEGFSISQVGVHKALPPTPRPEAA
ncbi:MAG: hypothetical protein JO212_19835 [Acetobacteraceae bacterium]|nr:hypothetical protein [Acetobacteraceae bacterium]MBV8592274.1 hypothetical protein [Acetobacteraceae bacterium]